MAKKKKKEEPIQEVNVKQSFENVKILIASERPKEAIAYIYLTYANVIAKRFQKPRSPYQTIREYAITCVNDLGHDPGTTYGFIKRIEDIIYGGVEPTHSEIQNTINLFSSVYNNITGKTFSINI